MSILNFFSHICIGMQGRLILFVVKKINFWEGELDLNIVLLDGWPYKLAQQ
jgi:hypothetical protein